MHPVVSIIIPTFNYGAYIAETLTNLLDQTFNNWECIIVDDGSTDDTAVVVKRFTEKDRRIQYHQQQNRGVSAARNQALSLARGQFIQLLDADDLLSASKLGTQIAFMEGRPDVGISYTDAFYFRHGMPNEKIRNFEYVKDREFKLTDESWIIRSDWSDNGTLVQQLYSRNLAPINSMLIRKQVFDAIGNFDESFVLLEDWYFFLKAAINDIRFTYFDNEAAYAKIRVHEDSSSYRGERISWYYMKMMVNIEQEIHLRHLSFIPPNKQIDMNGRQFIRHNGLTNLPKINALAKLLGWGRVIKLYLKELNAARKAR